uniref:MADS-box domain-containing protein n=1 Tax=Oryza glumipatula TaxID=40148 RepID=A0A0D9YL17_9ORYZ
MAAAAAGMGGGGGVQQQETTTTVVQVAAEASRKKVEVRSAGRRGRREMRRIEDATSRQVTFSKRRSGLLKKAFELSVLCDAEVALIVFSPRGRLYQFASASSDLQRTIDRYLNHTKNSSAHEEGEESCKWRSEATNLGKKIEAIEGYKSKLLGEGLGSCSVQELQELEVQLEKSLCSIRQKKQKMLMDQILELREKEMNLLKENMVLRDQCKALSSPWSTSVGELKNKQADDDVHRHEDYSGGGVRDDDDRRMMEDVETDLAAANQAGKVLKKGKKKQAKDELDRQKQAEKKRRRLEKALANSAAIISELEKKKQKKREEQQRLDEEGAAIAEAVALHVLIGEDSDEPCHLMLNKHRRCNHWDHSAGFDFAVDAQGADIYPPDGLIQCADHVYAPKGRCIDWGIGQPLPSLGEVKDLQLQAPCYQGMFHQSVACPGFIAAQAVSSLQIGGDSSDITSPSQGATVVNRMLGATNRLNLYREI